MSAMLLSSTPTGAITYGYLVDAVERYFDAVDKYDLDGVLSFSSVAGPEKRSSVRVSAR